MTQALDCMYVCTQPRLTGILVIKMHAHVQEFVKWDESEPMLHFHLREAALSCTCTDIVMHTDGSGNAHFEISEATDGSERAWVVRLHLRPNQRVAEAVMDGVALVDDAIVHLAPLSATDTVHHYFPFGGAGSHPPVNAGHVVELKLPSAVHTRSLSLKIV